MTINASERTNQRQLPTPENSTSPIRTLQERSSMDTPLTYSPIGEWEAPGPREGSTPATHQCGASQRQRCDQTGGESRAWCALEPGHTSPHGPPIETPESGPPANDDITGFNVVPERYATDSGREAIDIIRDSMSDHEFAVYCRANALKYSTRLGKKGEADGEKMRWYTEMSAHVLDPIGCQDPRSGRPGFTVYKRDSVRLVVGRPDVTVPGSTDATAEPVMSRRIPDADSTAYPWYGIVDPRQIMEGSDVYANATAVTGVWFDRPTAQAFLDATRYNFGPHARVFAFSGHASKQWRALCEEPANTAIFACVAESGARPLAEAEELRSGIEKLMAHCEPAVAALFQRLLDDTDARDSLCHLMGQDTDATEPGSATCEVHLPPFVIADALEMWTDGFRESKRRMRPLMAANGGRSGLDVELSHRVEAERKRLGNRAEIEAVAVAQGQVVYSPCSGCSENFAFDGDSTVCPVCRGPVVFVDDTSPPPACEHLEFDAEARIARLTDSVGVVTGFAADLRVSCAGCKEPFVWKGLEAGVDPNQPMVSIDGQELRAPITLAAGAPTALSEIAEALGQPPPGEA